MQLVTQFNTNPDKPFTAIHGQNIGSATTRYIMFYGPCKLKRIAYTPYGSNNIPPVWHIDETIISNLTIETVGNTIAQFLEDKWQRETAGKTLLIS